MAENIEQPLEPAQNTEQQLQGNEQDNPQNEQTQPVQLSEDDIALQVLRQKGFEIDGFDDLRKEPVEKIVEKVVNPYESVLDDDDKAYLNYKKETGRSRKDYEALNRNLDEVDPIVFARERLKQTVGSRYQDEELDEFLEDELGIDLHNLDSKAKMKLAVYGNDIKQAQKAEQEKYRKPAENKPQPQSQEQVQSEYLQLDNGTVMKKTDYEAMVTRQQQFITEAKEAGNSVTESVFEVAFDDNGTQRIVSYSYEHPEQDRHSVVSRATDLNSVIKSYETETGFKHKEFQRDLAFLDPKFRGKAFSSLIHKAIAQNTEELMKTIGNVNFNNQQGLHKPTKEGVKMVSATEAFKLR